MYIPTANEEKRVSVMHELIRAAPFGTLVTMGVPGENGGLFASHIPMVLELDTGTGNGANATSTPDINHLGTLKCHVARGNRQWRDFSPSVDALAIFAGQHHYISASWYPEAQKTGAEVPTWNYVAVHAYGPLRAVEEPQWLLAHLQSLTDAHEAGFANPWNLSDAPVGYIEKQMRGIVGLEMPIRRLEGKWKASQNRNERDRDAVVAGLDALGTPDSLAMKRIVEERRPQTRTGNHLPNDAK